MATEQPRLPLSSTSFLQQSPTMPDHAQMVRNASEHARAMHWSGMEPNPSSAPVKVQF